MQGGTSNTTLCLFRGRCLATIAYLAIVPDWSIEGNSELRLL